jgi:hypothetical protein
MVQAILVGLVSGVAAALLFVAPASGTPFGVPLFALTGLPLAIAGFGWGTTALLLAAAAAALGVVALVDWPEAVIFAGMFGIPVAGTTAVAMQPRPEAAGGGWWPVGILLLNAAAAVAICTIAVSFIVEVDPQTLVTEFSTGLADLAGSLNPDAAPPTAASFEPLARALIPLLPATGALVGLAMVVIDLYLGALAARFSERLRRPQENLWTAAMPWTVSAAFVVATAIAFAPGTVGFAARAVAGSLGLAVALTGLAVIHALTRGMNIRITLLSTLYVLLVLLSGLMLPLLALLGIAESVFHLRARRLKPRGPTPT